MRGARHGKLDDESYCFLHGLPTKHTGSWQPDLKKNSCDNERCASLPTLWEAELYNGKLGHANWRRRRAQECDICAQERKRRCRVLNSSDLSPALEDDARFADAPYIHAFNEPKYHASQVRALHFAKARKTMVLWFFAEDRPLTKHIELVGELKDLNERRQQWSRYHEMKTGGIMGLQPLVYDMPLRITQTDHERKDKGFFKNNRCRLFGWELHHLDEKQYSINTNQEMVLQYLPVCLYVKFPGATWVEHEDLGPGVGKILPQYNVWALDNQWNVKIERHGFFIASDFSGTAHSFQGANLTSAIIDCNGWDSGKSKPSRKEPWPLLRI